MVTQDTSLLHRSVKDNILYGRPDATEIEMIEAAKRAEAHEFILNLRDAKGRVGYDAVSYTHLDVYKRQVVGIYGYFIKRPLHES